MRINPVKRTLREGGVAIGTMMMEFGTTGIDRIAAEAGAEFAVFDIWSTPAGAWRPSGC
jgi:2-dehydro-3-deoxyglucarate aldolase/4-hydroxy-2-oxoheptanedioate aldolase